MLSAFYLLLIKLGQVLNTGEREKLKIGWKQSVDGYKGIQTTDYQCWMANQYFEY
jgi:hypothetical protein